MSKKILLAGHLVLLLGSIVLGQTADSSARKFDEFGDIQASDLIARLDNLAIGLMNEPGTKAFLVVYRTRRDLPGLSSRYANHMKGYLIDHRGVSAERIVIVDGGVAACLSQELWIVPPGFAPKPRDDAFDNSYHGSVYKFDEHPYRVRSDPDEISYWPVPPENLSGYLDSYGETLLKDRKLVAYLIAFRGQTKGDLRSAQRMLQAERNFLVREFGISPTRIKTVVGGYSAWPTIELWVAQPGYRPIITSYQVGREKR